MAVILDKNAFDQSTASINRMVSMIITLIIVIVVVYVVYRLYKATKTGSEIVGDKLGGIYIQNQTGIPVARQNYIKNLADEIEDAVSYWLFTDIPFSVDEDVVVNAVNEMNSEAEANLLSKAFKAIRGISLKADVIKSSAWGWGEEKRIDSQKLNWIS